MQSNGNVGWIANTLTSGRTQNFTYDELNRIKTAESQAASGTHCWGQRFGDMVSGNYVSGYDIWANLTKITVSKCSAPTLNVTVNSNNRISSTGFSYDAAGNLTAQSGSSYSYDADGRLTSTAGVTYTYDGDGRRVKKSNGTLYWYGVSGEVLLETDLAGNNPTEYIFFAGKRVARRTSSGTIYYYFEDHLGTSRVIVQAGQNGACYEADFYPFGGERPPITNTCPQNYKFTGQERDAESGLDYMYARHDASNLGRFLQADNFMNDTSAIDPASWNLYAYVRNNPLRYVDPTGEKIYAGDLSEEDLAELLSRLDYTYGCDSCVSVDAQGFLAVDTTGLSQEVVEAAGFLTGAINSTSYFAEVQVSNNDPTVAFGATRFPGGHVTFEGVTLVADLIVLDFGDDRHISGDAQARAAFLNTVFAHEVAHRYPTAIDDPRDGAKTGPVVDKVNRLTDALGLPRRTAYFSSRRGDYWFSLPYRKQAVDSKGAPKHKDVYVDWLKRNVGGRGIN